MKIFEEKLKTKEEEISSIKKKLEEVESEREKIEEEIGKKYKQKIDELKEKYEETNTKKEEIEEEIETLKEELKEKDKKIIELRKEFTEDKEKLKSEYEKKIRELENKKPTELGDEGQARVYDVLVRNFPYDKITETKRGKAGSDIFHKILYDGQEIGLIIYEVKNVMTWNNDFIKQIKEDKTKHSANYALLVSNVFPAKEKILCEKEGITIVCPDKVAIIAKDIRNFLIELHKTKLTGEEVEEKIKILQEYLTSPEYRNALHDLASAIKEWYDLRYKEKASHERHWAEEEKLNNKIYERTAKIHAKIASIIETKTQKIPLAISYKSPKKRKKLKKEI